MTNEPKYIPFTVLKMVLCYFLALISAITFFYGIFVQNDQFIIVGGGITMLLVVLARRYEKKFKPIFDKNKVYRDIEVNAIMKKYFPKTYKKKVQ